MSLLKENKKYFLMLLGIFFLFLFSVLLSNLYTNNPYALKKFFNPILDMVNNEKSIIINTSKNYVLTLNTTKGDIKIQLRTAYAPFNVNNMYVLANQEGFANSSLSISSANDLVQLSANKLKRGVYDEINFESLRLNYIKVQELRELGYISDGTIASTRFEKYNLGVVINPKEHDGPKNSFVITTQNTDNSKLDGYYTNIGFILSGKDIIDNLALTKAPIKIIGSNVDEL